MGNDAHRLKGPHRMSLEATIRSYAADFISAADLKDWKQEAHVAFVAYVLKRELGLESTQVQSLMEIGQAVPALLANASAFRQKCQGKEWGYLLPEAEGKTALQNRFGNLI
jgi:hypothetical protein